MMNGTSLEARAQVSNAPPGAGWKGDKEPRQQKVEAVVTLDVRRYHRKLAEVEGAAVVSFAESVDRLEGDPGERVEFSLYDAHLSPVRISVRFGLVFAGGEFSTIRSHGTLDRPKGSWAALAGHRHARAEAVEGLDLWREYLAALAADFSTKDLETAFGSAETGAALLRSAAVAKIEDHIGKLSPRDCGRFYSATAATGVIPSFETEDAQSPLCVATFADELRSFLAGVPVGELGELVAGLAGEQ